MSQQPGFELENSIVLLDEFNTVSIFVSFLSTFMHNNVTSTAFLWQFLISFIIGSWQCADVVGYHIRWLLFVNPLHKFTSLQKQKIENMSVFILLFLRWMVSTIAPKQ